MGKREHKPVIVEVEPLSEEHRKVLAGMDAGLHRNWKTGTEWLQKQTIRQHNIELHIKQTSDDTLIMHLC